jgi:hypothetical protein
MDLFSNLTALKLRPVKIAANAEVSLGKINYVTTLKRRIKKD